MKTIKLLAIPLALTLLWSGCLMWHGKSTVRVELPDSPRTPATKRIPLQVLWTKASKRSNRKNEFRDALRNDLKHACETSPTVSCGGGRIRLLVLAHYGRNVNPFTLILTVVTLFAVVPITGTETYSVTAALFDHHGRLYALRRLKHEVGWAVNFPVMIIGLPLTQIPGSKAFAGIKAHERMGKRFTRDLMYWLERQVPKMDAHLKGPKDVVRLEPQRRRHRLPSSV